MRSAMIAVASILVVGVVACTLEPPTTGTEENPVVPLPGADGDATTKDGGASEGGGDTCPYTGTPIDVTAFATCSQGGRCVPQEIIPAEEKARLSTCATKDGAGGLCVPEKIIAAKGLYLPTTCASISGAEGRCTSRVFPDMEKQKDTLPKDVCDETERCAPCFDPATGAETGACRSVKCDAPKQPKVVFGECCKESGKALGRCVPTVLIPQAGQDGLETKECKGEERCVPAETLAPTYVPPKCKAQSLFGSYDGVCISNCVKKDFFTNLGTGQGDCAAESFCAPCKNPLTGAPTGAPGCK